MLHDTEQQYVKKYIDNILDTIKSNFNEVAQFASGMSHIEQAKEFWKLNM